MKQFLPLLFLFFSSIAVAQTCTLRNNADFCSSCAALINPTTGVISGVITVPNNSGAENIPATCNFGSGPIPLVLGALTLDVGTNSNLIIDEGIFVQSGVTSITLTGNGTATMTVDGVTYSSQTNANPNFLVLQNAISNCANAAGCNTIGEAITALPVALLGWTVSKEKESIVLSWSSSAETDNDFYLVEHSVDGNNFSEMGQLRGQTTAQVGGERQYRFEHKQPAPGRHYYRLSQQDFDGTRTQLGLKTIVFQAGGSGNVSPNPVAAGGTFRFTQETDKPIRTVALYSVFGRLVTTFSLEAGGAATELTMPADLPAGLYFLRTAAGTTKVIIR